MKIWYEVFKSDEKGTRTLAICHSLTEAIKTRVRITKNGEWNINQLYIDKWCDINNPKQLQLEDINV